MEYPIDPFTFESFSLGLHLALFYLAFIIRSMSTCAKQSLSIIRDYTKS